MYKIGRNRKTNSYMQVLEKDWQNFLFQTKKR